MMLLNWPIISLGYFGLGLSMTQLGDDKLVSFILGALVEIPGRKIDRPKLFNIRSFTFVQCTFE